jgi:hypothetical protein
MTKKGLYEIGFLQERMREVEAMLESWDKGSQAYLIAKELREIYGYLLTDARKDRI